MRLEIRPITLAASNDFVRELHRHHGPTRGHKFSISVCDETGAVRGVAISGRPVARLLDDGLTLEVLRLCTDGAPMACSMLYAASARAGKAMGYRRIITYTLASETGVSLRASGWTIDSRTNGDTWNRPNRSRSDNQPTEPKVRWRAP